MALDSADKASGVAAVVQRSRLLREIFRDTKRKQLRV